MLISLNEIKKYVKIPENLSTSDLLDLIGSRLVEIEDAIDLAPKYKGIYIVKVASAEKIEGTHLTLCQVDAGPHTQEFSSGDTVQVVCGAPNVHAGMLAVWITPGSIVPSTYGNENFRLSVRKLQGHESNGMLAAVDELDLGTDHDGIICIDPADAKPGDSFAEVFGLNDIIIDVENKSLTHRPDCFGLIGFAREVAGILGQKFEEPEWINGEAAMPATGETSLTVEIDPELCPRYCCAVFDLPDNEPSKYLTSQAVFLAKAGMRAIDPLVDMTNYLMLQTGQPLHAFDYDKLIAVGGAKDGKIIVRAAREGEELQLLDGKTVRCIPEDILVTSNNVPVALAGAMGGKNTEIDASTKRVILESATFSLYHLRKTQMAHGIFSEAITRFTKGQPASMPLIVLHEFLRALSIDQPDAIVDAYPHPVKSVAIDLSLDRINNLLGTAYDAPTVKSTLENVGFEVSIAEAGFADSRGEARAPRTDMRSVTSEQSGLAPVTTGRENRGPEGGLGFPPCELRIVAPAWRTDIHLPEDLIEEIGRLLGFDNIPLSLPVKSFRGAEISPMWSLKQEIRRILSLKLGLHELLTYSFISKSLLEKVGQKVDDSYEIVNSISPELECFRAHIAPSLLDKIRENEKSGYKDFTLYEMNQVSGKSAGLTPEGTPALAMHLGVVTTGDFYELKAILLAMLKSLRVSIEYRKLSSNDYPYLEPKRSAEFIVNGEVIGAFGEVKPSVLKKVKLEHTVSACELSLDSIVDLPRSLSTSLKISKFPFVERDLTLKVAGDAQFGRFHDILDGVLRGENLIASVTPVSIYQSENTETKNISFHVRFSNPSKTLAQDEISDIMEKMTVEAVKLGAEVV